MFRATAAEDCMEEMFRASAAEGRALLNDLHGILNPSAGDDGKPAAPVDVLRAAELYGLAWDKFEAAADQVTEADVDALTQVGKIVQGLKAAHDLRKLHASMAHEGVIGTSCFAAVPEEHQTADPLFFKVCGVMNAVSPGPLPVLRVNNVNMYAGDAVGVAHRATVRDFAHGLFVPTCKEQVVAVYVWRVGA